MRHANNTVLRHGHWTLRRIDMGFGDEIFESFVRRLTKNGSKILANFVGISARATCALDCILWVEN